MTVSANYSMEFSRDRIIRAAFQMAGLVQAGREPDAENIATASDLLNAELMSLQSEGHVLRTVERSVLALVAGTNTYTLPADTLDVNCEPNDVLGTVVSSANTETPVFNLQRAEYLLITNKSTTDVTGTPTRGLLEKLATVQLTLYPTPTVTDVSFRYARVRLLRDLDDGGVTPDLSRKWTMYLIKALAANLALANNLGLDKASYLRKESEVLKAKLQANDTELGSLQFSVSYGRRY